MRPPIPVTVEVLYQPVGLWIPSWNPEWLRSGMSNFVPFNREQSFLLPPDLKEWLPAGDVAHFIIAAVERVPLSSFQVSARSGGRPQYHPHLMLTLLIYCYANGIFSSRRIERATYRDIGVRFVAANLHPDHDTIAVFQRTNKTAFEAAFLQVLLLARESGLLTLGTVSIDGTKIDANASKIRSVRYDRATQLRAKLASDIADLTAKAEAADADEADPQALPAAAGTAGSAEGQAGRGPVNAWKPRRRPRPRRHVRPMKLNKQPMTARQAAVAQRRCRLIQPRQPNARAT
jgi:transposase